MTDRDNEEYSTVDDKTLSVLGMFRLRHQYTSQEDSRIFMDDENDDLNLNHEYLKAIEYTLTDMEETMHENRDTLREIHEIILAARADIPDHARNAAAMQLRLDDGPGRVNSSLNSKDQED